MVRRVVALGVPLLIGVPAAVSVGTGGAQTKPVEFSDARLKVEIKRHRR